MSGKSVSARALVLKKTKLKEADLILTLLASDGEQLRCVAKGARKPGGSFAARLELLSVVDLLLYEGRSLYTVTEVRVVETNERCRSDVERLAYCAVVSEFAEKVSLEGQANPVLFDITVAALKALGQGAPAADSGAEGGNGEEAGSGPAPYLVAAYLIKATAYLGFKPMFDECTACGAPLAGGATSPQASEAPRREVEVSVRTSRTAAVGVETLTAGVGLVPTFRSNKGDLPQASDSFRRGDGDAVAAVVAAAAPCLSISAGGCVCADCAEAAFGLAGAEAGSSPDIVEPAVASWVKALLGIRFSEIPGLVEGRTREESGFAALAGKLLEFCELWIGEHLGIRLKSLTYLSRVFW